MRSLCLMAVGDYFKFMVFLRDIVLSVTRCSSGGEVFLRRHIHQVVKFHGTQGEGVDFGIAAMHAKEKPTNCAICMHTYCWCGWVKLGDLNWSITIFFHNAFWRYHVTSAGKKLGFWSGVEDCALAKWPELEKWRGMLQARIWSGNRLYVSSLLD